MDRITELEVVASFLGRHIVPEQLEKLSVTCLPECSDGPDCVHYSIDLPTVSTNTSVDSTLSLQVIIEGEILISAHIRKFVHLHPSGGRVSGYETNPTYEDLDAVKRLLSVFTQQGAMEEEKF